MLITKIISITRIKNKGRSKVKNSKSSARKNLMIMRRVTTAHLQKQQMVMVMKKKQMAARSVAVVAVVADAAKSATKMVITCHQMASLMQQRHKMTRSPLHKRPRQKKAGLIMPIAKMARHHQNAAEAAAESHHLSKQMHQHRKLW